MGRLAPARARRRHAEREADKSLKKLKKLLER